MQYDIIIIVLQSIPLLMMTCIKELESKWLDTEGLYRVAGGITHIRDLAAKVNKGHFKLIEECCDPNVVTSLVKKFLKELPDALIPNSKNIDPCSLFYLLSLSLSSSLRCIHCLC